MSLGRSVMRACQRTRTGRPVSLSSCRVKDDLWDTGRDRKVDTSPSQGMHEVADYMI